MKINLKQICLVVGTTLALSNAWAGSGTYDCKQTNGKGHVEIRIQFPSILSGKYVGFSDLLDGGHGPTYDFDYTELKETPYGMPVSSYVIVRTGMLGLILEQNMYYGGGQAYAAETEHNSTTPTRIYECYLK